MEYRNIDCPNCGLRRVQSDGVCEKCLWDVDGENYASITRPKEYDHRGRIVELPQNDPFEQARNPTPRVPDAGDSGE